LDLSGIKKGLFVHTDGSLKIGEKLARDKTKKKNCPHQPTIQFTGFLPITFLGVVPSDLQLRSKHAQNLNYLTTTNSNTAMATVLSGSNDKEKLDDLTSRPHKDQAVWFLNAFWEVRRVFPSTPLFLHTNQKKQTGVWGEGGGEAVEVCAQGR